VQRTGILIEKNHQVDFKGAAHRNIGSKQASSPITKLYRSETLLSPKKTNS